jgi:pimeloyl-ACP methyl ester carboxylesterase
MQQDRILLLPLFAVLITILGCTAQQPNQEQDPPEDLSIATNTPLIPTLEPTSTLPGQTDTPQPTAVPVTPTPDISMEEITFTTQDGIPIAATLFGDGELPILMLHMGKGIATHNDQADWHPVARRLAEGGYPSLTVDFRGRGGSGGEFENDPVILDVQAALDFLRQRGFSRYVCLGAGLGGTTCMVMALTEPPAALIILSSTLSSGPNNSLAEDDLVHLSMPKLFAYGENDGFGFPDAMQAMYRRAPEPKEIAICDSAAHGSDLLYGSCGEEIYQQILAMIQGVE